MRNKIIIIMLLAAIPGVNACGYHLSGKGSLIPQAAKTIAVPAFINNTNEPYVDLEVTKAVVDEFIADGRLRIVDVEVADLALRGIVVRYEVTALSFTTTAYVRQYQVRILVNASLDDLKANKTLWRESNIEAVFISDYPVDLGSISATKIVKEAAIKKASQDIAWTLRSRVLEGF